MKHKWVTLVTTQSEMNHQNSQYFYPSEPFTLDHINMRHPVIKFLSGWERKCHAFESNLVIYSFAIENFNDYFKDKDF